MLRQLPLATAKLAKAPQILAVRMSGTYGDGVGKGGGTGGSIRDAGGVFGKMEAAREGEYFMKKEKEVLEQYRQHMAGEQHGSPVSQENQKKLADLNAAQNAQSGGSPRATM